MTRQTVQGLFDEQEYGRASSLLELWAMLRPGEKQVLFDLARAQAFDGDGKRAVESLKQAVASGFDDIARVESEPAFSRNW